MSFAHDTVVWFSKSFGLFYMIGFAIVVVIYAYWPANQKRFDAAARSILGDEDEPWR